MVDRNGKWGFFRAAIESLAGLYTDIEPKHPDMTSYDNIIIGSPIWTGKLSIAIRSLIENNLTIPA